MLLAIIIMLIIASCKREISTPKPDPDPPTPIVSSKVIDTAISYTKDIYLWYDQLPANMPVSQFKTLDSLMNYIKKYSRDTVAGTGSIRNVDRWSFAILQSEWDKVSQGIAGDLGLSVFFFGSPSVTNDLRVKYVEKLSPAGKAGIKRGWRITKINDHSSITTSDADINYIVQNIFNSASATITFQKPDNTTQVITLNRATYQEQPIFVDTVYNQGTSKVGYMVFNSFLGDSTYFVNDLKKAFTKFTTAGISDMIVDLRYNSGGYVWVQQLLANYLVNNAANNRVMMIEQFNNKYTNFNDTAYFKTSDNPRVNFYAANKLNLNRLYFIVSKGTASASELLINNLKPYMSGGVKLIGANTEGKAVGFFNIPVGDYYIFPVSFKSVNGAGQGKYFDGLIPDGRSSDGLDKDWGDVNEACLRVALQGIGNNGVFLSTGTETIARSILSDNINQKLEKPGKFNGMIERNGKFRIR